MESEYEIVDVETVDEDQEVGKRPFVCSKCGKGYLYKRGMVYHMRIKCFAPPKIKTTIKLPKPQQKHRSAPNSKPPSVSRPVTRFVPRSITTQAHNSSPKDGLSTLNLQGKKRQVKTPKTRPTIPPVRQPAAKRARAPSALRLKPPQANGPYVRLKAHQGVVCKSVVPPSTTFKPQPCLKVMGPFEPHVFLMTPPIVHDEATPTIVSDLEQRPFFKVTPLIASNANHFVRLNAPPVVDVMNPPLKRKPSLRPVVLPLATFKPQPSTSVENSPIDPLQSQYVYLKSQPSASYSTYSENTSSMTCRCGLKFPTLKHLTLHTIFRCGKKKPMP